MKRSMKIGLVCPYNMARAGAVQEIVRDMQAGLTARGHTVKIITGQPKGVTDVDAPDVIFAGTVTDFKSPTHTLASFARTNDPQAMAQALAAEQFDVLHFHEPAVPILSKQILDYYTGATMATFHAKLPATALSQAIGMAATPYLRTLLDGIDELVVGSEAAADFIRTLTNQPLHYIPNGIDLETFKPAPYHVPGARKTILYVSRLEHRKGTKYLVRAFARLSQSRSDVKLLLAGSGPDRAKLEALVAELGVQDSVEFLGFVDNATKLRLFQQADLFCVPAIFGESFGLVLLEAMASGLVTVAGNNPGYSAVMQDRGALSLVDPLDTSDFARRLELLLDNEGLRKLWREWALEYVKQFDYRGLLAQYEVLYEQAVRKHASQKVRTWSANLVP
jgi:phosphatidylinositol alpha-mannosyltransferase